MSKFMYNGKPYGGSTNYASSVTCTDAKGNESTVQAEIDELNKNFEWKIVGITTGTNSLKLPSDFSELFIEVKPSIGYAQIFRPIIDVLTSSLTNYAIGFAGANSQFIKLGVSLTEVKLAEVSYGGNDKTSGSTVTVYYK